MNIQQLAEQDAAEREERRRVVIRAEEAALQRARERKARTDAIQRHLDQLNVDRCHWHFATYSDKSRSLDFQLSESQSHFQDNQPRCYERAIPGGSFCAEHLIQSQP